MPWLPSSVHPHDAVVVNGLTGATAATRYVGATASGAPASGTFAVGDFVITQDGSIFICTAAGSPGTWTEVSGSGGGGGGGTAVAASGAMVERINSSQTFANETFADMEWDSVDVDDDGFWSSSPNPERLTAPETGWYQVSGYVRWDINTNGYRYLRLQVNGANVVEESDEPESSVYVRQSIAGVVYLTAGDYVTLNAYQSSGGNLDIDFGTMQIVKVGSRNTVGSLQLPGPWLDWTPTWTAFTTNPTIGNGTITGKYQHVGNTVHVWLTLAMGSTTTFGSGAYRFDLPVLPSRDLFVGSAWLMDFSNSFKPYVGVVHVNNATAPTVELSFGDVFWSSAGPFTLAQSDVVQFMLTYETDEIGYNTIDNDAVGYSGARAYRTTSQSISTATNTAVEFDNEEWDTDDYHDNSTNPSRFTAPTAGKYLIEAAMRWASNTTGSRNVWLRVNGTTDIRGSSDTHDTATAGGSPITSISKTVDLAAGDYVEVIVRQDSGGALGFDVSSSNVYPVCSITRIGQAGFSGARVYLASDATSHFTDTTWTAATWDTEDYDTDGYWEGVTNPERFTAPVAGKYMIGGTVSTDWDGTPSGEYLNVRVLLNGTTQVQIGSDVSAPQNGSAMRGAVTTVIDLAAGDYVELQAFQSSGAARDQNGGTESCFWIVRLSGAVSDQLQLVNDRAIDSSDSIITVDQGARGEVDTISVTTGEHDLVAIFAKCTVRRGTTSLSIAGSIYIERTTDTTDLRSWRWHTHAADRAAVDPACFYIDKPGAGTWTYALDIAQEGVSGNPVTVSNSLITADVISLA